MLRQSSRFLSRYYSSASARMRFTPHRWPAPRHHPSLTVRRNFNLDYRLRKQTNISRNIPLGSMTASQIEKVLANIHAWRSSVTGFDLSDLLVNRLGFELISGSVVARDYLDPIVNIHLEVAASYQTEEGLNSSHVEKAERLLRRVTSWYQAGVLDTLPVDTLEEISISWLALDSEARAAELLLWWTHQFPDAAQQGQLLPVFEAVLDKCFDLDSYTVIVDLTETMKELKDNHGWTDVGSYDDYRLHMASNAKDAPVAEPSPEDEARALGLRVLKNKIIDFLKDATKKELKTVNQYKRKLQQLTEFSPTPDVSQSFLDYYIRIQDSKEAVIWLQRLDVAGSNDSSQEMFDKYVQVLHLVADSASKKGSPWRASELVRRMEELEVEEDAGIVTTEMYNLYCSTWAQSNESKIAFPKVRETFLKMTAASEEEGRVEKAPDKRTYELLANIMSSSPQDTLRTVALVANKWGSLDTEIRQEQVSLLMGHLTRWGLFEQAVKLIHLADQQSDLVISEDILSDYVLAHAASSKPESTFKALDFVRDRLGGKVPLECFSKAMTCFLEKKDGLERQLIDVLLIEACRGTLMIESAEEVRELLVSSIVARPRRAPELSNLVKEIEKQGKEADAACLEFLSTDCFNFEMGAWQASKSPLETIECFERLKSLYDSGHSHLAPNKESYSYLLFALASFDDKAQEAEHVLNELIDLHLRDEAPEMKPDPQIFDSVFRALRHENPPDVMERSMTLLNQMQELDLKPDLVTYNALISSVIHSSAEDKFSRVMEIREMMKENDIEPDVGTYDGTVQACMTATEDNFDRAFNEVLECTNGVKPYGKHLESQFDVLEQLLKVGNLYTGNGMLELLIALARMQSMETITQFAPSRYIYWAVIDTWIRRCRDASAIELNDQLLASIQAEYEARGTGEKPNSFIYDTVLRALAGKGKEGALEAERILDNMDQLYLDGDVDLKPNTKSYYAVIIGLAKNGEADRAENVLQKMISRHQEGNDNVQPSNYQFNAVIDALSKSGGGVDAAERAEALLDQMNDLDQKGVGDLRTDTFTVNSVLDAWSRSGSPMAPLRVEQLLDQMEKNHRDGNENLKPSLISYNILMNAWSNSDQQAAPARTEDILSTLVERYRDGDNDLRPDATSHLLVVNTWAKSGEEGAHKHALRILKNMQKLYDRDMDAKFKPSIAVANAVCKACAFASHPEDHEDAYDTAFRVLRWMNAQKHLEADSHTYTTLLSVCQHQLFDPDIRFARARTVFQKCCKEGWVNEFVLRRLYQVIGEEKYDSLVGDDSKIPHDWTRKARRWYNEGGRKRHRPRSDR